MLPRFDAPASLRDRIRTSLRDEDTAKPEVFGSRRPRRIPRLREIAAACVLFAVAILGGYRWGEANAGRGRLFDEAVAEHVRSLQVDHLTDVASTDQHTVKPWFAGKLDFSPPVIDLADVGYPLIGGRLDHIDGRPAAALVYRRRQHAINVFVWPGSTAGVSQRSERDGYSAITWSSGGFDCIAVSEIPEAELASFSEEFRKRLDRP